MLIFIDDSGDPGFKLEKGSTRHFVIVMVIFDDELEAEKTALAIKQLKRELGFSEQTEFRFFKTSKTVRLKFLGEINKFRFRVRCLIVDKTAIRDQRLINDTGSFYANIIKEILRNSYQTVSNAKIRIDGGGYKILRQKFFTYIRRELNFKEKRIIKNCKLIDSKSDVLIQLADMIAGSIHRSQNIDKPDHFDYLKVIKNHVEDIWRY